MKFKDIIDIVEWDKVWEELIKEYPDQKKSYDGYYLVFYQLKELEPKESDFTICVERVLDTLHKECCDGEELWYYDVNGKNGTLQKEDEQFDNMNFKTEEEKENFGNQEVSYALEFTKWEEWLGMEISEDTLIKLTDEKIVAYCLYEMTFCGYEQDEIQSQHTELKNRVDDIKNMTEEDLKKNTVTIEELKEKLNRRLNS